MPWYVAQMYVTNFKRNRVILSQFYIEMDKKEKSVWVGYILRFHRLCLKVPYFIAIAYNIVHIIPCLAINIVNTHVIQLCAFFDMHKRVCVNVYLCVFGCIYVYYLKRVHLFQSLLFHSLKALCQAKCPFWCNKEHRM